MTILITSFDTWLNYQRDNASDRLLTELESTLAHHNDQDTPVKIYCRRRLPVDIGQAGGLTLEAIEQCQATTIICCGMAEGRNILTLESNARRRNHQLCTPVDLNLVMGPLTFTGVSHDAGQFVCEGLYYEVLTYGHRQHPGQLKALFVHVPWFSDNNGPRILEDFWMIVGFLCQQHQP